MTPVLQLAKASKRYSTAHGAVQALTEVDLAVQPGEILGLVGESGCGKSTLAKAAIGLIPLSSGEVRVDGAPIGQGAGRGAAWRPRVQMVFQDPSASLNPRSTIGRILEEPLIAQRRGTRLQRRQRVVEQLEQVGLRADLAARYPHELSGGQKQRVGIGRALILQPELVICDEAVSALDVSVQAQVINLLLDMRQRLGLAYLFISHDLRIVRHVSDRIAVMYFGRVVEQASREDLWRQPLHPYTRALIGAEPRRGVGVSDRLAASDELPSPLAPPSGCAFHPRCPMARDACRATVPALRSVGGRTVACHLA